MTEGMQRDWARRGWLQLLRTCLHDWLLLIHRMSCQEPAGCWLVAGVRLAGGAAVGRGDHQSASPKLRMLETSVPVLVQSERSQFFCSHHAHTALCCHRALYIPPGEFCAARWLMRPAWLATSLSAVCKAS